MRGRVYVRSVNARTRAHAAQAGSDDKQAGSDKQVAAGIARGDAFYLSQAVPACASAGLSCAMPTASGRRGRWRRLTARRRARRCRSIIFKERELIF